MTIKYIAPTEAAVKIHCSECGRHIMSIREKGIMYANRSDVVDSPNTLVICCKDCKHKWERINPV